MKQVDNLKGHLLFLPFGTGTKSESFRPGLVIGHGPVLTALMEGDNPFENQSLRKFNRKFVEVSGELDSEKRMILIRKISSIPTVISFDEESLNESVLLKEKNLVSNDCRESQEQDELCENDQLGELEEQE